MKIYSITGALFYSAFGVMLVLAACKKKEAPLPGSPNIPGTAMEYFNCNDRVIKAGVAGFSIDCNHDGRMDLAFSTQLVGDPINQVDKLQFLAAGNIKVNFAVNANEEIPVMKHGDPVPLNDFDGYRWFELSSIRLVQKITSFTRPPFWEGHWKNALHQYLPYQLVEGDRIYCGWVELSVDTFNEKLVIHKVAISKEANKIIKAGI